MCIKILHKQEGTNLVNKIISSVMSDDTEDEIDDAEVDTYYRKYHILLERCTAMQQDNERLVNRIQRVRKMLRRARKERKFLMARLDQHGDSWRNIPLSLQLSDDSPPAVTPAQKNSDLNKSSPQSKASGSASGTGFASEKTPRGKSNAGGSGTGSSKRKNKDTKDRDPSAPKRPANPYFQFCQEQRPLVSEQYTSIGGGQDADLSKQELTKLLASRWNSLTTDDKKVVHHWFDADLVYYDKYEKQKEKYSADMQMYSARPKFSHLPTDESTS